MDWYMARKGGPQTKGKRKSIGCAQMSKLIDSMVWCFLLGYC